MNEEKLKILYRLARIIIYLIPAFVVAAGLYLILFPVDSYYFYPDNPKLSKFEIIRNEETSQLSFGVFPMRDYRYIELTMNFEEDRQGNCLPASAGVAIEKTYRAFTFPVVDPVENADQLRQLIFENNKTKYPNGSLLHLRPTNEVFLISHGKKILFPGPEIFQAFGYSFDNLTEVEKSDIDQFPDADQKVFLWTMPHPGGTIFQAFPSHSLYLVLDGKKIPIADKDILAGIWPGYFSVPVSDFSEKNKEECKNEGTKNQIVCHFDSKELTSIGRFYLFSVNFPQNCLSGSMQTSGAAIRFFSEKSAETARESVRGIAASVFNRYFYQQ